jgi:hypothetical protein
MWCWRKMKKVRCTDHVRWRNVTYGQGEEGYPTTVTRWKAGVYFIPSLITLRSCIIQVFTSQLLSALVKTHQKAINRNYKMGTLFLYRFYIL